MPILRVLLAIAGVYGVVAGTLPVSLTAVILGAMLFSAPETVAIGLAYDLIWSPSSLTSVPWVTIAALVMLWASEPIRREILR
jgi:hypothetical protein